MFIKAYACALSFVLVIYAGTSLLFRLAELDTRADPRFCAVWLCPEEFAGQRPADLVEQSAGERSVQALSALQRALRQDPASAYTWANLGDGFAAAQQDRKAEYCFRRAIAAGPRNPAILLRAANFSFREGDLEHTFAELSIVLRNPELNSYYEPVFLTYIRSGLPIQRVLEAGVPAEKVPAAAFLRFLMQQTQIQDAITAWNWVRRRGLYDVGLTNEYLLFLLNNSHAAEAADTWASLNNRLTPEYRRSNWIFNGSFEQEPVSSPFDWNIQPVNDVQAGREKCDSQDGQWCLQLLFGGSENIDYHQLCQQTYLNAGKWKLEARIRTAAITTDKGVGLKITGQKLDVRTENLNGSHNWTNIEQQFDVSSPGIVRIEVVREASAKFDNKISGTAWVDNIQLSPVH